MIYKTPYKKLKIEQHESHEKKKNQTNKHADELKCPGKSEVQDCDETFVTTLTTRHQVIKTDDTVFLSLVASNKTFC